MADSSSISSAVTPEVPSDDPPKELWNDAFMIRVLEETAPWERKSLEMVCRRLYHLSSQTSFKTIENLHLFLERFISSGDNPDYFKIYLKSYNLSTNKFEKIKYSTLTFPTEEIQFLESYIRKCHRNVKKVTVNCMINENYFKMFDYYLRNLEEFNCRGINNSTMEYFYTSGQKFTSRITTLRLKGIGIPSNCDFLTPFSNLQNLYFEENRSSRNLLFSLQKRDSKLKLISLKEDRPFEYMEEEWNQYKNHILDELQHCSERLEFINTLNYSYNPFHINLTLKSDNLTSLEVSLAQFQPEQIRRLLENICHMKLEKLVLKDVNFNRQIFLFRGEFNSKTSLKELTFENWTSLDGTFLHLDRLVKQSLRVLKLNHVDLFLESHTWQTSPIFKCLNLEDLEFCPRNLPKTRGHLLFYSKTLFTNLHRLKKIKRIVINIPTNLDLFYQSVMNTSLKNLRIINFVMFGIEEENLKKMLEEFYGEENELSEYHQGPNEMYPNFPTIICGIHRVTITNPACIKIKDLEKEEFVKRQCQISACLCKNFNDDMHYRIQQ